MGKAIFNYKILFFVVFSILSGFQLVLGKHYAGAELSYKCLGTVGSDSSRYEIKLTVYRDCRGEEYAPYYDVIHESSSCGIPQTILRLYGQDIEEITNICPGEVTNCQDPASLLYGIEKREYIAEVTLPHCTDWVFWWENQNRNADLSNINNVGSNLFQPIRITMNFDNKNFTCNDFFDFSAGSMMNQNICVGDTFVFDFKTAMGNSDGDSSVFTLVNPQTGATTYLNYNTGFNYLSPIQSSNGFYLNPTTGILTFAPTYLQQSIFAIRVDEYRDGVKIGSSVRDMQLITEECTNERPTLFVADSIFFCVNRERCVEINGYDADGDDFEVTVLSNGLPGVPISNNGKKVFFCWEPDTNDIGTFPVTLLINDHRCPVSLQQTKTVYISVPSDINFQCKCASAGISFDNSCYGTATAFEATANLTVGSSVSSWNWDFGDGSTGSGEPVNHTYSNPGTYNISATFVDNLGCSQTAYHSLRICEPIDPKFVVVDSCQEPKPVIFEDTTEYDCPGGASLWLYGDGEVGSSSSHLYEDTGWFDVKVYINYGDPLALTQCLDSTSLKVHVNPRPEFTILPNNHFQSCDPSFDTILRVVLADTAYDIQWFVDNELIPAQDGGTNDTLWINTEPFTLNGPIGYNLNFSVEIEDSLGCTNDSARIIFDPVRPRFLHTPYCNPGDTIYFWDLTTSDTMWLHYDFVRREWDFNDTADPLAMSVDSFTSHYFAVEDYYNIYLSIFDSDSCYDIATEPRIDVVLPDTFINIFSTEGETDSICFDNQKISFVGPEELRATIDRYVWYIEDSDYDSIEVINDYGGGWLYKINGVLVRRYVDQNTEFDRWILEHRYDPDEYGEKHIELKVIYNTVKDHNGMLIDSLYCEKHFYDTIYLRPPHLLDISYIKNCMTAPVEFRAIQDSVGDGIISWEWDFGDNYINSNGDTVYSLNDTVIEYSNIDSNFQAYQYATYDYPDIGLREVLVTVVDTFGCDATQDFSFRVIRMDTMSIRPEGHCNNEITVFPPASFDRWENIDLYRWDFGDTLTEEDTSYIVVNDDSTQYYNYTREGWHLIFLEISGSIHECRDTLIDSLFIDAAPVAQFQPYDSTCLGEPTIFEDSSRAISILNDTILYWQFIIEEDTIEYFYPDVAPDTFAYYFSEDGLHDSLRLLVISSNGCAERDMTSAWIAKTPIADFNFIPQLPAAGDNVVFNDRTDFQNELIHETESHSWRIFDDTGDLDSQTGNALYSYDYYFAEEGVYNVELIARNIHNCTDTAIKEIDTYAFIDFPNAFSPDNNGHDANNIFRLFYKGIQDLYVYEIYNRYGELVFDGGSDLDATWNGTWRGKPQETGSYVVMVKAVDVLGREINLKKNLLLIR